MTAEKRPKILKLFGLEENTKYKVTFNGAEADFHTFSPETDSLKVIAVSCDHTITDDDDIAGYTCTLKFIAPLPGNIISSPRRPLKISGEEFNEITELFLKENEEELDSKIILPDHIVKKENFSEFYNIRNGLYVFSVAAIDTVGNIGKSTQYEFIANKYIPVTYISSVKYESNDFGDTQLTITGGGFTYDGQITSIFLDRDGLEPYDCTLRLASGDYAISSNNRITDIVLKKTPENTESGSCTPTGDCIFPGNLL